MSRSVCFRYITITFPLVPKSKPLAIFCTDCFVSDIPETGFVETSFRLSIITKTRPMRYNAIFHGCKNVNFQMKNYNIFLIFAQNIDCGYTLEVPTIYVLEQK